MAVAPPCFASTIVLAASIFLFYGGMEIQAVHFHLTPALGLEK